MLEALITKISSAISPLRLVYHSSRPIDRRLITCGFAEIPWFFRIKVTGADRAQSFPELRNRIMDVERFRGQACPHTKKSAGWMPALVIHYISRLSGRKG